MLALTALEDWYITGLHVHSAYLYGKLDEEIYMEQPEGFAAPRSECKVLHLWCALYGLKQAGLAWWRTLDESLQKLGFERLKSEAGIFFYKKKGTNIVIGIIYVDCHGSTGSPSALLGIPRGGVTVLEGGQGSSQRYWILYLANSRESIVSSDCIERVRGVPCDPNR